MRLIDADKLIKDIKELWDYKTVDGITAATVLKQTITDIENQPTVKAIPIDWIEKKAQEFLMNRNFRWATDFQEVVDMWKVENNLPLFDNELKITWEKENGEKTV